MTRAQRLSEKRAARRLRGANRRSVIAIIIATFALASGGAIAWAAISAQTGPLTGCFSDATGGLVKVSGYPTWTEYDHSCPSGTHARHAASADGTATTSTTTAVTTTTKPPTTTTVAPTTTTIPTTTTTRPPTATTTIPTGACSGVPMTSGQADINNNPTGTTFCLSGTHNWSLTPKAGDTFIGPAILDGGNSTAHAFNATAPNVTLTNLTIQHYQNGNGSQDAAIHIADDDTVKAQASGWHLNGLDVGFNSASGAGTGNGWIFTGGRYHDNRQEGIGGAMGSNVTIDGVEVDHNDFTDTTYTTRNWSCGDEAGGIKWVTNDMHITNSFIHDNACKGVWADLEAARSVITNNRVWNNWDEGIFIEISSGATVTGNDVRGNGLHNYNQSGCSRSFGWAGGITISTSGRTAAGGTVGVDIGHNTLAGNCQGITGIDSFRNESPCPCELWAVNVHDNTISGTGQTGAWSDDGDNLTTHQLTWTNNTFSTGATFCGPQC